MYYSFACNRGLFNSYNCYVLFENASKIMKNVLIPCLYILYKQMCYKKKNSSFDVMKNAQIFPSEIVCSF